MRVARLISYVVLWGLVGSAQALAQSNLAEHADASGPHTALERFGVLNQASALTGAEGAALLAGELDALTQSSVGPLPSPDRIVMLTNRTAVARLPAQGEGQPDAYLYLREEATGRWTINALRSLALMGIPMDLRRQLRSMSHRNAEQEQMLANLEITLASDERLRTWFAENRAALERLRQLSQAARPSPREADTRVESPAAVALLQSLHALVLRISQHGVVRVTLGGMVDNEVGFMFAPSAAAVPPIDAGEYIWIEPLGDGWYLYKTT